MYTEDPQHIVGFAGHLVPHTFVRQDMETDRAAILLPDFAYTWDMPLFYYAESLLLDRGVDVLRVDYAYHREPSFLNQPVHEQHLRLFTDTARAFDAVLG